MLKDLISGTGLSLWQAAALVIFVAAFVAILVHTLLRSRAEVSRAARLPIDDQPGGGKAEPSTDAVAEAMSGSYAATDRSRTRKEAVAARKPRFLRGPLTDMRGSDQQAGQGIASTRIREGKRAIR